MVLELRPPGMDKGVALTAYVRETGAGAVLYAGDDLGDLPAFAAVEKLRSDGTPASWSAAAPSRSRNSPTAATSRSRARRAWWTS